MPVYFVVLIAFISGLVIGAFTSPTIRLIIATAFTDITKTYDKALADAKEETHQARIEGEKALAALKGTYGKAVIEAQELAAKSKSDALVAQAKLDNLVGLINTPAVKEAASAETTPSAPAVAPVVPINAGSAPN